MRSFVCGGLSCARGWCFSDFSEVFSQHRGCENDEDGFVGARNM